MRFAIGVDLGGTNMRAALVREDGHIVAMEKRKTPVESGPEATARGIAEMAVNLKTANANLRIEGLGVGSPGPLSRTEKKVFKTANLPGFEGYPIGYKIEEYSGLIVQLDNDAKCAAYGEGQFGAAKGLKNYILMTFGTGIGGGILVDGKMIYGKSDGACEVGHFTLYPDGELCGCGNRGCFEKYASASAIQRRSEEYFSQRLNARQVFEKLQQGDKQAEALLRLIARDIALGTASLVNLFDPEAVIFGGGIFVEGGGPMIGWIREGMKDRCFESSQKGLKLEASALSGHAGMLGAASLVFRAVL